MHPTIYLLFNGRIVVEMWFECGQLKVYATPFSLGAK